MRAAKLLVSRGATRVFLASRSGRVARDGQGLGAQLQELGTDARVVACDGGDFAESVALLCRCQPLTGMLHAAGVLSDKLLRSMAADNVGFVLEPKAMAASHLHKANSRTVLEALGLFSSVSSTFGNVGQASYAAANSYLDALAFQRRSQGGVASSLQIPAVRGAGMGASTFDAAQLDAIGAVTLDEFAACLLVSLAPGRAAAEGTQAPLVQALIDGLPRMPLIAEMVSKARPVTAAEAAAPTSQSRLALAPRRRRRAVIGRDCGERMACGV